MVGSLRRSSTVKSVGGDQHQIQDAAPTSSQPLPAMQPGISEPKGQSEKQHIPHLYTVEPSDKLSYDEDGRLDESAEPVLPTLSELFDFPPPPPQVACSEESSDNLGDKVGDSKRAKGKQVEGMESKTVRLAVEKGDQTPAKNVPHRRTRTMLNERTFAVRPRYSSPPSPSPIPRSSLSRLHPSSRSSSIPKPSLSAPDPTSSQTPKRQGWSRLSNPLPLPPGWTFRPNSMIPVRAPDLKLSNKPSYQDSLRASRSHSRSGSASSKRSLARHHQGRRPPSPRPTNSICDQSFKPTLSHRRSWSAASPVRRAKDPRISSFSSLGSIVGGNSSESDSCSNASSFSVAVEVVVEPRVESQLSLASWPYSPPPLLSNYSNRSLPLLTEQNHPDE